jgi:putative transcriptional regulator
MTPQRLARAFLGLCSFLPVVVAAQSTRATDLAAGKLLVASRDLHDPNFAETVVLLVHYDEEGVLGLILNRRTRIPIGRAFPDIQESAKGRSDSIYEGGPVQRAVALALLRSRGKIEKAECVFADVCMVSGKPLLEKILAEGTEPGMFRLYSGYSGWTAEQLQREVELGGWHIFRGDASMVFDAHPESLWSRLIRKTEERIALSYRVGLGRGEQGPRPGGDQRKAGSLGFARERGQFVAVARAVAGLRHGQPRLESQGHIVLARVANSPGACSTRP